MNDPEDRFCILDLTLFQQRFTLAVVYGPNNDDPNFFLQLSEKIGAVGNEAVIAVGDWNVVLDYEWDTVGYKHKNNPKANAAVLDLMKILDLGGQSNSRSKIQDPRSNIQKSSSKKTSSSLIQDPRNQAPV